MNDHKSRVARHFLSLSLSLSFYLSLWIYRNKDKLKGMPYVLIVAISNKQFCGRGRVNEDRSNVAIRGSRKMFIYLSGSTGRRSDWHCGGNSFLSARTCSWLSNSQCEIRNCPREWSTNLSTVQIHHSSESGTLLLDARTESDVLEEFTGVEGFGGGEIPHLCHSLFGTQPKDDLSSSEPHETDHCLCGHSCLSFTLPRSHSVRAGGDYSGLFATGVHFAEAKISSESQNNPRWSGTRSSKMA